MNPQQKLISIRFSHYVEKVRWTMDRLAVPYEEVCLMPILHYGVVPFYSRLHGKADSHSTMFSTPVLKTDQGKTVIKSTQIMKYLDTRFGDGKLFPNDEVLKLDDHYNRKLGPHTRMLFYFNVLNKEEEIFDLAKKNVSPRQAWAFKRLFSLCKPWINSGLGISEKQVEKGVSYIFKEFEAVENRLKDGRPFLTGDHMTAADISFACLGGAIVLPTPMEGYGAWLPTYESQCPRLIQISKQIRESDVGKWVLNLYKNERGRRILPATPPLF